MESYLPVILEVGVFVLVLMVANILARPFRRRRAAARATEATPAPTPMLFLAFVAGPLLVLLLSYPAVWLFGRFDAVAAYMSAHPEHLRAWKLFWLAVLGIDACEGAAQLVYAARRRPFPLPDLLLAILRALLILGAALLALRLEMGIDIAPLLASTALVTAVIGFALQGVLGNLLAGMSLHVVRGILPGDWIRIGDTEGRVVATNWRETRLQTVDGFLVVVPNSQVAGALIHNMSRPDKKRRHRINVGASYSDAPEQVIAALLEAARAVPEVLKRPAPDAYVTEFQDYGINYQLRFWSQRYHLRLPLEGDVNRMIWYQFKRRGIEIPFPMSDKLLNDFMAVVYNQRRLAPEQSALDAVARDLRESDFGTRFCVDAEGAALLTETDFAAIAPKVRRQLFTRGEAVARQGEAGDSLYVVVRGSLAGRVEPEDGTPPVEFRLEPGAIFGEMSLMLEAPRSATVSAEQECELLVLDADCFRALLSLHPEIPEKLAALVSERAEENAAALAALQADRAEGEEPLPARASILKRFLSLIAK